MDPREFLDNILQCLMMVLFQNYPVVDGVARWVVTSTLALLPTPSITTVPSPSPILPPPVNAWIAPTLAVCVFDRLAIPATMFPTSPGLVLAPAIPPIDTAPILVVSDAAIDEFLAEMSAIPLSQQLCRVLDILLSISWSWVLVAVVLLLAVIFGVLWGDECLTWSFLSRGDIGGPEAAPPPPAQLAGLPDSILAALRAPPALLALVNSSAETEGGAGRQPPAHQDEEGAAVDRNGEADVVDMMAHDDEAESGVGSMPQTPVGRPLVVDDTDLRLFMFLLRDGAVPFSPPTPSPFRPSAILEGRLDSSANRYAVRQTQIEELTSRWREHATLQRQFFGLATATSGGWCDPEGYLSVPPSTSDFASASRSTISSSFPSSMSLSELGPARSPRIAPQASTPAAPVLTPISWANVAGPSRSSYQRQIEEMTPRRREFCARELRYVADGESPTRGDYSVVVNAQPLVTGFKQTMVLADGEGEDEEEYGWIRAAGKGKENVEASSGKGKGKEKARS
ncbi:hypothetical protein C8F04DRAFT_1111870 [Mycena alexandri]|uniref:Uncharacterized protein n=1 Tax=Mycena alexandri TaxID=1745969 RepID=A0AAD6SRH6_9AGAR|nr:hypothetical protein C8F04DRAFT_1111870 [Mycena alexandri]